ncbi:uncharacterized protein LOC111623603 [Centruroides sculpturatus]|uniref:uncharacterized protein LOC111623603 n=1 Tax=Centruroides sculpturatus TaxID=218467 RepID=UPI000C6EC262|nr:uncharacterized protein LOC111623603 [Centruroides sculpturatus]
MMSARITRYAISIFISVLMHARHLPFVVKIQFAFLSRTVILVDVKTVTMGILLLAVEKLLLVKSILIVHLVNCVKKVYAWYPVILTETVVQMIAVTKEDVSLFADQIMNVPKAKRVGKEHVKLLIDAKMIIYVMNLLPVAEEIKDIWIAWIRVPLLFALAIPFVYPEITLPFANVKKDTLAIH